MIDREEGEFLMSSEDGEVRPTDGGVEYLRRNLRSALERFEADSDSNRCRGHRGHDRGFVPNEELEQKTVPNSGLWHVGISFNDDPGDISGVRGPSAKHVKDLSLMRCH